VVVTLEDRGPEDKKMGWILTKTEHVELDHGQARLDPTSFSLN